MAEYREDMSHDVAKRLWAKDPSLTEEKSLTLARVAILAVFDHVTETAKGEWF